MYQLTEDGSQISSETMAPDGIATPKAAYGLDIPDASVDIVKTGDRWWVVDADGQVHQYDRYWRYTGDTRTVGSGNSFASYPGHIISVWMIFVPVLKLVVLIPGMIVLLGRLWRHDEGSRVHRDVGAAGALLFVYGMGMQPYFVRPIVFSNVYLPLLVTVAALVLPIVHIQRTATREWHHAKPLLVTYAPAIVAALTVLMEAVRPLTAPY